jgi:hypothetical protein
MLWKTHRVWSSDSLRNEERFGTSVRITSLTGALANDVWSAGGAYGSSQRMVSHWTGADWSHAEGLGELIWENSSTDIWLCCGTSTDAAGVSVQEIQHWDGARWSSVVLPEPTRAIRDLWSDADELWLLDERGIVLRWDGVAWSELPIRRDEQINAIWGDGDGRLWAAGTLGLVVRYDGGVWSVSHTGGNDLKDLWGSSFDAIRAVGASGTVLRWDGGAWRPEVSGTTSQLNAIWGSSAENVWITGNQAVILRKRS